MPKPQSKIQLLPGITMTYTDGPTVLEVEESLRAAGARAFIQMVGESEWSECGLGSAALLAHAQDRMTARGREWRLAIVYPK